MGFPLYVTWHFPPTAFIIFLLFSMFNVLIMTWESCFLVLSTYSSEGLMNILSLGLGNFLLWFLVNLLFINIYAFVSMTHNFSHFLNYFIYLYFSCFPLPIPLSTVFYPLPLSLCLWEGVPHPSPWPHVSIGLYPSFPSEVRQVMYMSGESDQPT